MALTQTINADWREFLLTRQRLTLAGDFILQKHT